MIQIINKYNFARQVEVFQQYLPEYEDKTQINQLFKQLDSNLKELKQLTIQHIKELISQDSRIIIPETQLLQLITYFQLNQSIEEKIQVIQIIYYLIQNGQNIQQCLNYMMELLISSLREPNSGFPYKIVSMHFNKLQQTLEYLLNQENSEKIPDIFNFLTSFFINLLKDYVNRVASQKNMMSQLSMQEIKYMQQILKQQLKSLQLNLFDIISIYSHVFESFLKHVQLHPYILEVLNILIDENFYKVMQNFYLKQKKTQIFQMINGMIIKIQEYSNDVLLQNINGKEFIIRLWTIQNIQSREQFCKFSTIIQNYYNYLEYVDPQNKQYFITQLLDQLIQQSNNEINQELINLIAYYTDYQAYEKAQTENIQVYQLQT